MRFFLCMMIAFFFVGALHSSFVNDDIRWLRNCSLCGYSCYLENEKEKYTMSFCKPIGCSEYSKYGDGQIERRYCPNGVGYQGPEEYVTCLGGKVNDYCITPCSVSKNSDAAYTLITYLFIMECTQMQDKQGSCFFCVPGFIASSPGLLDDSKECFFTPCYAYSEFNGNNNYASCCLCAPMVRYQNGSDDLCLFFNGGFAQFKDFSGAIFIPFFVNYNDDLSSAGYCCSYCYMKDKNTESECSCCLLAEYFKDSSFKHGFQCAGIGCGQPKDEEIGFCQLSLCHHPFSRKINLLKWLVRPIY